MPWACNFIKKETLAQVFSCEFCEISKNTFFIEHLWTTASQKEEPYALEYVPGKNKTQEMCESAVDYSLKLLKFVPDWFVAPKTFENFAQKPLSVNCIHRGTAHKLPIYFNFKRYNLKTNFIL